MQTLRLGLPTATAAVLALAAAPAWAAGFGEAATGAVLGRPLDFAVALRLEPGDDIAPRCISARVTVGDRTLPNSLVTTSLEPTGAASARVRVLTSVAIDEPVVGVVLDVGCQARQSRRFVVLADPPAALSTATAPFTTPSPPAPTSPPAAPLPITPTQVALIAADPAMAAAASAPAVARASDASGPATTPPDRLPARTARRPAARQDTRADRREPRTDGTRAEPRRTPVRRETAVAAAPRLMLDATTPDTELTMAQMVAVEQALQAVAEAASAVRAANEAASAAEARAQGLARTADQLRADAQAERTAAALMRQRLARSESASNWVWPLLAGLLMLGGLAGWLVWQLASLRREQRLGWQLAREGAAAAALADAADSGAGSTPTAPVPMLNPAAAMPAMPATRLRTSSTPSWPPAAPAESLPPGMPDTVAASDFAASTQADDSALADREPVPGMQRTLPLPPVVLAQPRMAEDATPLRDLTIEELIDLEQQAEFFIVLGQDEAAIDLLVEHIRGTGGSSPLPYLKLLEVYQRRGDREAYERTRGRFNQRFNAYAADWGAGLLEGRGLEDYPGVLPRLAQVWARPLDAMAELEAMLFRKSRGELFDLPAYREVLFLYALARDLLDREAADTGNVDLLLPLADGGKFGLGAPHPYFGLDRDSVFDRQEVDDQPTSPVDLDLSQDDGPASIVDPLAASRSSGWPAR